MNTETNIEKSSPKLPRQPVKVSPAHTAPNGEAASPKLEIFTYLNYREYLGAWLAARKQIQAGYSGSLFAKKAGIQSHTLLGMVIRGERNLSAASTRAFLRALSLKGRDALYFEKLVLFNQSKNSEDRAYYFEQLCAVSNQSSKEIITKIQDHASYLSHWYNVAIREMVHLEDFEANPEWIAKKLKNKITKKQAEEAWALLLKLKMVELQNGRYRVLHLSLDIDPGTIDFAIRNFHREYLERAKEAIDGESIEERELSSMTLSVSEEDLLLLKERIKEFRKKLNTEFPVNKSQAPKTVVAVNMQALVLTEKQTNKPGERK